MKKLYILLFVLCSTLILSGCDTDTNETDENKVEVIISNIDITHDQISFDIEVVDLDNRIKNGTLTYLLKANGENLHTFEIDSYNEHIIIDDLSVITEYEIEFNGMVHVEDNTYEFVTFYEYSFQTLQRVPNVGYTYEKYADAIVLKPQVGDFGGSISLFNISIYDEYDNQIFTVNHYSCNNQTGSCTILNLTPDTVYSMVISYIYDIGEGDVSIIEEYELSTSEISTLPSSPFTATRGVFVFPDYDNNVTISFVDSREYFDYYYVQYRSLENTYLYKIKGDMNFVEIDNLGYYYLFNNNLNHVLLLNSSGELLADTNVDIVENRGIFHYTDIAQHNGYIYFISGGGSHLLAHEFSVHQFSTTLTNREVYSTDTLYYTLDYTFEDEYIIVHRQLTSGSKELIIFNEEMNEFVLHPLDFPDERTYRYIQSVVVDEVGIHVSLLGTKYQMEDNVVTYSFDFNGELITNE